MVPRWTPESERGCSRWSAACSLDPESVLVVIGCHAVLPSEMMFERVASMAANEALNPIVRHDPRGRSASRMIALSGLPSAFNAANNSGSLDIWTVSAVAECLFRTTPPPV